METETACLDSFRPNVSNKYYNRSQSRKTVRFADQNDTSIGVTQDAFIGTTREIIKHDIPNLSQTKDDRDSDWVSPTNIPNGRIHSNNKMQNKDMTNRMTTNNNNNITTCNGRELMTHPGDYYSPDKQAARVEYRNNIPLDYNTANTAYVCNTRTHSERIDPHINHSSNYSHISICNAINSKSHTEKQILLNANNGEIIYNKIISESASQVVTTHLNSEQIKSTPNPLKTNRKQPTWLEYSIKETVLYSDYVAQNVQRGIEERIETENLVHLLSVESKSEYLCSLKTLPDTTGEYIIHNNNPTQPDHTYTLGSSQENEYLICGADSSSDSSLRDDIFKWKGITRVNSFEDLRDVYMNTQDVGSYVQDYTHLQRSDSESSISSYNPSYLPTDASP